MGIEVLIGGTLPGLMQDIIRRITSAEPDLTVSEDDLIADDLVKHLETHTADVVVLGCDRESMEDLGSTLFERSRRPRVIAVVPDSGDAVLFSLELTQRALGQLSADNLIQAIRSQPFTESAQVQ